ncbi:MAG: hypothetical protein IT492_21320 [Gammaproteobacteria bacterium]|nr:hypothetical protein [Gammaproteobacteria bacterium]
MKNFPLKIATLLMLLIGAALLEISLKASLRDADSPWPGAMLHVTDTPAKGVVVLLGAAPTSARVDAYAARLTELSYAVLAMRAAPTRVATFDALAEQLAARVGAAERPPVLVALGAQAARDAAALRAGGARLHALVSLDACPLPDTPPAAGATPVSSPWYAFQHQRADCDARQLEAALAAQANTHLTWLAAAAHADHAIAPEFGALLQWLDPSIAGQGQASARMRGIPLIEMPVANARRAVIFLSGDGGWAALDRGVAAALNDVGLAVLGWDTLSYFWQARSPAVLARDLERVIDEFRSRWRLEQVVVAGYSFGASSVPFAVNGLSAAARAMIEKVVLLGPTATTSFEFRLTQWLGSDAHDSAAVAPEIAKLAPLAVWCVHGAKDQEAHCPPLAPPSRVVTLPGDHHFNDDYSALARVIATPPLAH